jgi:hypothetical protein
MAWREIREWVGIALRYLLVLAIVAAIVAFIMAAGNSAPGHPVDQSPAVSACQLPPQDPDRQRIQRIMRAAPRPEPVGETDKVLLVDGVEHLDHRSLDDLVLQGGDAERALPPVRLWYVHPTRRARPVGPTVDPAEQVFEVRSEVLPVGVPRHLINSWCGLRVDRHIGRPETRQVDMMQQWGEPCFLVLPCYFAHTIQPAWHAGSGSASGTCRTARVPLGQPPSLHRLRTRSSSLVRRLRRYYEVV